MSMYRIMGFENLPRGLTVCLVVNGMSKPYCQYKQRDYLAAKLWLLASALFCSN